MDATYNHEGNDYRDNVLELGNIEMAETIDQHYQEDKQDVKDYDSFRSYGLPSEIGSLLLGRENSSLGNQPNVS